MKKIKDEKFFYYVNDFIKRQEAEMKSEKTIETYRNGLNDFRKYLYDIYKLSVDKISFSMITDETVRNYLTWIVDNHRKISTRNIRLSVIKNYIRFCAEVDISYSTLNIGVTRIKSKMDHPKKHNWLNREQIDMLLKQPSHNKSGIRDRFIMIFLFSTGARLNEFINIKLKDLNLDCKYPYIRLFGKGDKERVVPLLTEFIDNYRYYLQLFHKLSNQNEFLVYTVLRGTTGKMSEDNVQRIVKKYGDMARKIDTSFPQVHPHLFRHSYGAQLYRMGVSLPEVAKLLGHETLETTEIYAETDLEIINKAIAKLSHKEHVENMWEQLSEDDKLKIMGLKK